MTWLPFDLHPEYPPGGIPRADLVRRYGPRMHEHVAQLFTRHGLAYNPHPTVVPNSRDALRLTELARDRGLHNALHDRLMEAYWTEGVDIGAEAELRRLASEVGLDAAEVDEVLRSDAYAARVEASTAEAASLGVTGIPAFVLDGRLLILGAQPLDVFESAFAQLAAR